MDVIYFLFVNKGTTNMNPIIRHELHIIGLYMTYFLSFYLSSSHHWHIFYHPFFVIFADELNAKEWLIKIILFSLLTSLSIRNPHYKYLIYIIIPFIFYYYYIFDVYCLLTINYIIMMRDISAINCK